MQDFGLLILRLVPASFMIIAHGWSKLSNFSMLSTQFPDPLGLGSAFSLILAIFGEVLCPLLLILGLATRLATIPVAITMLVAAFFVHGQDPWVKQEFPLLYATIFITLFFTGGGKYGLGHRFHSFWLKS